MNMKTTDPEKQRIRKELAAEIRDTRAWLRLARKIQETGRFEYINRFKGQINGLRMAGFIVGK